MLVLHPWVCWAWLLLWTIVLGCFAHMLQCKRVPDVNAFTPATHLHCNTYTNHEPTYSPLTSNLSYTVPSYIISHVSISLNTTVFLTQLSDWVNQSSESVNQSSKSVNQSSESVNQSSESVNQPFMGWIGRLVDRLRLGWLVDWFGQLVDRFGWLVDPIG